MENNDKNIYSIDYSNILGKGSFGTVYKGKRHKNNEEQIVALKQIPKEIINDKNKLQLLSNEVVISAELFDDENNNDKDNDGISKNKNIVGFLDIIQIDNKDYLVYEFCNGGDLKRYLRFFKNLDEKTIQILLRQILTGLNQLHKKKIVHHDIKPENILVELRLPEGDKSNLEETIRDIMEITSTRYNKNINKSNKMTKERLLTILSNSYLKLSDFGLSKEITNYNKKEVSGSPLYIDPILFTKNINNETIHNEKVDIWAIGILAYEMFFNDLPFMPFPPKIEKLKLLLEKGEYFIDMKKCQKISTQFLSFLNMCLQRPQKIRPLTDELLLESEFITRDTEHFTYLTIDNYKEINFPDDSYLKNDGMVTMNIDDNRMINATFE